MINQLRRSNKDWDVIVKTLPKGWRYQAKDLGAFRRARGFPNASNLLRVMLIHLSGGCSLRETAVRAKAGGLAYVSDVALLNRLRCCGEWFRWMTEQMIKNFFRFDCSSQKVLPGRRVHAVDASIICEPGATGSAWRLHYKIDIATLQCKEAKITSAAVGESLTGFSVQKGDVLIGDRGLAHREGIRHVIRQGGDIIIRVNLKSIPLEDEKAEPINILEKIRQLKVGEIQHFKAFIRCKDINTNKEDIIGVKICALRKSHAQTDKSQRKLIRKACKKQRKTINPHTLEAAGYIIILTSLIDVTSETILELYRTRWQIELAFKRLKSLLGLGHLKKTDPKGAKAWLQGKMLIATIIEVFITRNKSLSMGRSSLGLSDNRRCYWRETSLVHFLFMNAVNPAISLISCLNKWDVISSSLREPPRSRSYQRDKWLIPLFSHNKCKENRGL